MPRTLDDVLRAADRAWASIVQVVGAKAPAGRVGEPWILGVAATDWDGGGDVVALGRDPRSPIDAGLSEGRVSAMLTGCALERAVARVLARAALWRAAPATDVGSATAQAEALAELATACSDFASEDDRIAFQGAPERTVIDGRSPSFDRGASAWFEVLDRRFARSPGELVVGAVALAPTRSSATERAEGRWASSPTLFDVLRTSLAEGRPPEQTFEDLAQAGCTARQLLTTPPRLAWDIGWPAEARRLSAPVPVAPTGASYVRIAHAGAPPGAKLRVEAEWEDYGRLRWSVIKLGPGGRVLAELPLTSTSNATHAAITVEMLDGVADLAIVACNVGSTDHPFDPNQQWWEPHGWLLTVQGQ